MTVNTRALKDFDDARRLGDLVYTAYGLTYHRSFMYDPHRLLELNQRGQIRSMLALAGDEVVGHIATIRPWFESIPPDVAAAPPTAVEVGLSIVHPDHRGRDLQTAIGLAALMNERQANPGLRNMFAKCLTLHARSQRSARSMLAKSCALLLGSVPSWVAHESGERPEPMTTVVLQSACVAGERSLYVPAAHAPVLDQLTEGTLLTRTVVPVVAGSAPLSGPTKLTRWFEPARRRGVVHVWTAGEELVAEVLATVDWLRKGHMEHVAILLPADAPGVAAAVPALEEAGLFFGGFLPDLDGRDVLVVQYLGWDRLDVDGMALLGDETQALADTVVDGWRRSRATTLLAG